MNNFEDNNVIEFPSQQPTFMDRLRDKQVAKQFAVVGVSVMALSAAGYWIENGGDTQKISQEPQAGYTPITSNINSPAAKLTLQDGARLRTAPDATNDTNICYTQKGIISSNISEAYIYMNLGEDNTSRFTGVSTQALGNTVMDACGDGIVYVAAVKSHVNLPIDQ